MSAIPMADDASSAPLPSTSDHHRMSYDLRPSMTCTFSNDHSHQRNKVCRSEEHTSELQSLMRISYAVFCLKKKLGTKEDMQRKKMWTMTQEENTTELQTLILI